MHSWVFECNKIDGDNGIRKSKGGINYKTLSVKNRMMVFTCTELKDLVREMNDLTDTYNCQQDELV